MENFYNQIRLVVIIILLHYPLQTIAQSRVAENPGKYNFEDPNNDIPPLRPPEDPPNTDPDCPAYLLDRDANCCVEPPDCLGVCGGSGEKSICSGNCISDSTKDADLDCSGTCFGNDTSCQNPYCDVYRVRIREYLNAGGAGGIDVLQGPGAQLSCLQELLGNCQYASAALIGSNKRNECDDNFIAKLKSMLTHVRGTGVYQGMLYDRNYLGDGDMCEAFRDRKGNIVKTICRDEFVPEQVFYMTSDCLRVKPDNFEVCGEVLASSLISPISLVWDNTYLDDHKVLVNFPLSPSANYNNSWVTWKASAKFPLLVIDQSGNGKITSYSQLFGNWTLGGKTQAKLSYNTDPLSYPTPWRDGFEALSQFDANLDDKISGEELRSLALWFDHNRDGVSQVGEILSLESLDIIELYYNDPINNPVSKDKILDRGFVRLINGKKVTGQAIDWYGEEFSTKENAIKKLTTESFLSDHTINTNMFMNSSSSSTKNALSKLLIGIWSWKITDKNSNLDFAPTGMLIFDHNQNDTPMGLTLTEMPLKNEDNKVKSIISALPFEYHSISKNRIRFTAYNKHGGKAETTAQLANNNKLLGKTKQTILDLKTKEVVEFAYEWEAVRNGK